MKELFFIDSIIFIHVFYFFENSLDESWDIDKWLVYFPVATYLTFYHSCESVVIFLSHICLYQLPSKPSNVKVSHPAGSVPVNWDCRIHRLHLCRGIRHPSECPVYDTKQSDGEAPVMQEFWEMQSIHFLPSFQCPLWPYWPPCQCTQNGIYEL